MTDEQWREIRTGAGVFRLTEEAAGEQAPPPETLERVRRDMEHTRQAAETEARIRAEKEARDKEARFAANLARHIEDRKRFHALRGVPESVFETELQPEIERKFVAGEKDAVEIERERRAASAY